MESLFVEDDCFRGRHDRVQRGATRAFLALVLVGIGRMAFGILRMMSLGVVLVISIRIMLVVRAGDGVLRVV